MGKHSIHMTLTDLDCVELFSNTSKVPRIKLPLTGNSHIPYIKKTFIVF